MIASVPQAFTTTKWRQREGEQESKRRTEVVTEKRPENRAGGNSVWRKSPKADGVF